MAKEIEYKFLVNKELLPELDNSVTIVQGYLSDNPTVRVRICTKHPLQSYGSNQGFITVKGKGLISREEFEYEIPYTDAIAMLSLCSKKLMKERFVIKINDNLKWEIDFFKEKNDGLVVAEIEVPFEGFEFDKPIWVLEDVSGKPEYLNVNLSY